MSNCTIRLATLRDYENVLSIGEVYNGVDYLPCKYTEFLEDDNYMNFLCIVDGEVIGFLCGALIDNREAFVLRAGRVKDAYQGQGYYKALRSHLYQTMSTIKSVKYEKLVVFKAIAEKLLQPDSGFEHIAMQKVYTYAIPESVVEEASSDLQPLNQKDLHRLLSDPETRDILFPGGILYVHRMPYKLTEGNFASIFNKRTVLFGSPSRNNKYKLVTTGHYFNVKLGFRYILDIYGSSPEDFTHHFKAHLALIRNLHKGKITVTIFTPQTFPVAVIDDILTRVGAIFQESFLSEEHSFRRCVSE
ncbi:histidine N-acetyltransferase-like [Haliotis rufescens]|uniref:histidine N-acetyltransferase-like n=1 Tax=Haliotis rufescens TaxID=6454 RepID=UPI00201F2146|nr:histidine N-acetyltransferase-like [Haliotis rufescens]